MIDENTPPDWYNILNDARQTIIGLCWMETTTRQFANENIIALQSQDIS